MSLWRRGRWYWMDMVVNGIRYREPLGTTDWREAQQLAEAAGSGSSKDRAPDPPLPQANRTGAMTVAAAMRRTPSRQRAQV